MRKLALALLAAGGLALLAAPGALARGKGTFKTMRTKRSKDWGQWKIKGPKGTLVVRTKWSKDWSQWRITDRMKGEDPHLKMAAIFVCVMSGAVASLHKR